MGKKTVAWFYEQLKNSMVGYEVNGNPMQRKFTLYNIANTLYKKYNKQRKKPGEQ